MDSTHLFLIDITYTADIASIQEYLPEHRAYLAKGYESGFLLASGPKTPLIGGVILGKFTSLQSAQEFAKNDPFTLRNLTTHTITEFDPVLFANDIGAFLGKN